jgi:general secretion pathway protein A
LFRELSSASKGVPRLINLICDRALLGAYAQGKRQITPPILDRAIKEILPIRKRRIFPATTIVWTLLVIVCITTITASQLVEMDLGLHVEQVVTAPHPLPEPDKLSSTSTVPALPQISALKWPDTNKFSDNEKLAFQTLFRLYGIEFSPFSHDSPCAQAVVSGWRCYSGHGGLSDLSQLDQPVLLRLSAPDGKEYSAALISLNQGVATVEIAGTAQQISLSELANSWLGKFVVIWKAPPDFNAEISLNHRGSDVVWLRYWMESVDGIRNDGSGVFDAALSRRIRAFQLNEGIQPDGQVGPLTLIRLNVRNNQSIPHLIAKQGR